MATFLIEFSLKQENHRSRASLVGEFFLVKMICTDHYVEKRNISGGSSYFSSFGLKREGKAIVNSKKIIKKKKDFGLFC